ncbi:MAG: oxidoreductase [Acidobacteria bacterium]|nr:MAG: oxidoreductase [Acidobacteriota bacterium]
MNEGLLLARLVFGLVMAAHGAQKLFGWFGGYGIAGTGNFFESIGFRPGRLFAALAGLGEFGGGLLLALGFLGPIGPASTTNGIEVPLLYGAAGVALALTGPGRFSIDAVVGLTSTPALALIAIAIGIVGAVANLALRRNPAPATA